ncbi:MAG: bifunctional folylpolyglutamate synthase/dihydrofolate synthase [Caldiserica bacterium]|nr:bifunctional folylpolyglutamate synthase/dihydrofolate synthase [Caldisericota bacterium]MCX6085496.1 bifunctional folylpolyglutamate synthase/dihydrofolate synthase [Caldisericota bacterium]
MEVSTQRTYAEALDCVFSLAKFGSKLGLERIRRIMAALGNPERRLRFVHVAGTKGKGSVCAFTARMLEEAGYTVGLYISPSLVDVGERISINGAMLTPTDFLDVFDVVWNAIGSVSDDDPVTVFEVFTAMAIVHFARTKVDIVVWEVGLGGLYDATNVIPVPEVAVITNIGLEHTDRLGNSVEEIATQKAGIIKQGGIAVLGRQDYPAAQATLLAQAEAMGNQVSLAGRDYSFSSQRFTQDSVTFDYAGVVLGRRVSFPDVTISLRGTHQVQNAASAITAVIALAVKDGIDVPEPAMRRALEQTFWPGRMELVPGTPTVLLDGAHTRTAARYLVESLHAHFPGQRFTMLFGVLMDKDMDGIAGMLAPEVDMIVLTRVPDNGRAASPWELEEKFLRYHPHSSMVIEDDTELAYDKARSLTPDGSWLLVTGSLYLVGAVRKLMGLYTFVRP